MRPGSSVAALPRVAVQHVRLRRLGLVERALQHASRQFDARRHAHADRAGHAIATDGHAVVSPGRRQVQHVARLEHPFLLGLEVRQDLQRQTGQQAAVLLAPDAPATPALHLQQEHVVRIEMRPDAAAVAGVGDHQIVEPRLGNESKAVEQCTRRPRRADRAPARSSVQPGVVSDGSARRGSGPWRSAQCRRRARAGATRPLRAGQRQQRRTIERRRRRRRRLPHQQGFFCQWRRMNCAGDKPPRSGVESAVLMRVIVPPRAAGATAVRSLPDADHRTLRRHADAGVSRTPSAT